LMVAWGKRFLGLFSVEGARVHRFSFTSPMD